MRALLALNERTLELFDAYRDAGVSFEMHTAGLVVAARTREGLDLYRAIFRRLRDLGYRGGAIDELDAAALVSLGLSDIPVCGSNGEVLEYHGLDAPSIVRAVLGRHVSAAH